MNRKRDASSSKLNRIYFETKRNYKYFNTIHLDDESDSPNELKPRKNTRNENSADDDDAAQASDSTLSSQNLKENGNRKQHKNKKKRRKYESNREKEQSKSDSDSQSSDEESDNDALVESNSDEEEEIKIRKLKKYLSKYKDSYKSIKHKLEKIDRALAKARNENNKSNVKKCSKYKLKYEQKLQNVKKDLKTTQAKLVNLEENEEAKRKEMTSKTKQIIELSSKNAKESDKNKKADDSMSSQAPKSIKLPYPVLNDKRDMKTILVTLETKLNELKIKTDTNKQNISALLNSSMNEINKTNIDKLRQLEQTYESQMDKLLRQIDYIKLSLHLETIRSRNLLGDAALISSIASRLNEMYMFMKNENILCLKKHALETSISQQSTKPQDEPEKQPTSQLNALFEVVNKSLAALLAHTAAAAHANANVNAYAYAYYYQQQVELQGDTKFPEIVPLKTEIEKASNTFAKYKDKISSFFQTSKKLETTISKINKNQMSNLNKLMINYSDNLSESDDDEDTQSQSNPNREDKAADSQKLLTLLKSIKESQSNKPSEKENQNKEDENSDKEDGEEDDDEELEIITTSELRSQRIKPNYLMPSLKASYFPLKASLDSNLLISSLPNKQAHNSNLLIAVEKSKYALTFLGNSNSTNQKQQKLSNILYG